MNTLELTDKILMATPADADAPLSMAVILDVMIKTKHEAIRTGEEYPKQSYVPTSFYKNKSPFIVACGLDSCLPSKQSKHWLALLYSAHSASDGGEALDGLLKFRGIDTEIEKVAEANKGTISHCIIKRGEKSGFKLRDDLTAGQVNESERILLGLLDQVFPGYKERMNEQESNGQETNNQEGDNQEGDNQEAKPEPLQSISDHSPVTIGQAIEGEIVNEAKPEPSQSVESVGIQPQAQTQAQTPPVDRERVQDDRERHWDDLQVSSAGVNEAHRRRSDLDRSGNEASQLNSQSFEAYCKAQGITVGDLGASKRLRALARKSHSAERALLIDRTHDAGVTERMVLASERAAKALALYRQGRDLDRADAVANRALSHASQASTNRKLARLNAYGKGPMTGDEIKDLRLSVAKTHPASLEIGMMGRDELQSNIAAYEMARKTRWSWRSIGAVIGAITGIVFD